MTYPVSEPRRLNDDFGSRPRCAAALSKGGRDRCAAALSNGGWTSGFNLSATRSRCIKGTSSTSPLVTHTHRKLTHAEDFVNLNDGWMCCCPQQGRPRSMCCCPQQRADCRARARAMLEASRTGKGSIDRL